MAEPRSPDETWETAGILVTDLDGTLLNGDRRIGKVDLDTLERLGRGGCLRVVATGRSLFSLRKVLSSDAPLDFILFSSGAGILDCRTDRIMRKMSLEPNDVARITAVLSTLKLDFMVHAPIPENHRFLFRCDGRENPDFRRRCLRYAEYCRPADRTFQRDPRSFGKATQFVVIQSDGHTPSLCQEVKGRLPDYTVVRTTSPLDGHTLWIEIFPAAVSKALSADWLIRRFHLSPADALAVGNDYNDADLLDWAGKAFVVSNAAESLKSRFPTVASHDENGVTEAVSRWLNRRIAAGGKP